MKKLMAAVLAGLMLAGLLSGCASTANDEKVEYRWKMALNSTEGDNAYDTGVLFAQKIKELTDGRVQVDLYGGAQLGTTAEVLEGMYAGVADVMCESIGTLATFTPLANIEAMPYMFSSYDHFMNVWYSDLGQEIKDAVGDDAGFKLMGASYRGPRVVCATKELKTIADFKGFKLRAPNLEMYLKTWQWAGANPTPVPMNEVYTALQQKTVDGQENPVVDSVNYAFDEVCNYWIKTNHVYGCNVVIMDKKYFESLPADIQKATLEAAEFAGRAISEQQADKDAVAWQEQIPTQHEGPTVRAMEARGIRTDKGNLNRFIRKTNALLREAKEKIAALIGWLKDVKAELAKPQPPMLNDLLALHCSIRNKGAYSNKAKNANLQRYAEAFSFLQSKNLYTVDDLENTLHAMQDKIDTLKKSASSKQARIKEVDELLRMVDYYKSGKPAADKLKSVRFEKSRQKYKAEHDNELRTFYMAERKLKLYFKDGKLPITAWRREREQLEQEYKDIQKELSPLHADAKKLWAIHYNIYEVQHEQERQNTELRQKKQEIEH